MSSPSSPIVALPLHTFVSISLSPSLVGGPLTSLHHLLEDHEVLRLLRICKAMYANNYDRTPLVHCIYDFNKLRTKVKVNPATFHCPPLAQLQVTLHDTKSNGPYSPLLSYFGKRWNGCQVLHFDVVGWSPHLSAWLETPASFTKKVTLTCRRTDPTHLKRLKRVLSTHPNIYHFVFMDHTNIKTGTLSTFFDGLSDACHLRHLHVMRLSGSHGDDGPSLARFIAGQKCLRDVALEQGMATYSASTITLLFDALATLQKLRCVGLYHPVAAHSTPEFTNGLLHLMTTNPKIEDLFLVGCDFEAESFPVFAALIEASTRLQQLTLSRVFMYDNKPKSLDLLLNVLSNNKSIHTLNMSDNNYMASRQENWVRFLTVNSTVTSLDLSNSCAFLSLSEIHSAFFANRGLTHLNLHNNYYNSESIRNWATYLSRSSTLRFVNLSSECKVPTHYDATTSSRSDIKRLCQAFQTNPNLVEVRMNASDFTGINHIPVLRIRRDTCASIHKSVNSDIVRDILSGVAMLVRETLSISAIPMTLPFLFLVMGLWFG